MINTDIVIIGAGPVGLFSVFQAGMLGMKSIIIDTLPVVGGQCSALYPEKPIYDIPAYPKINAQDLIENLKTQILPFNPTYFLNEQVISFKNLGENFLEVTTSKNNLIKCKALIIASGAGSFGYNKPPIANIGDFEDSSVFYKVTDKAPFKDKKIVIAGGGDSAVDWAIELSKIAEKIYLVHRREKFRCTPGSFEEVKKLTLSSKVELITPYQLAGLKGKDGFLEEVLVEDLSGNQKILYADRLLAFFGLGAALGPIKDWGLILEQHHIKINHATCKTNIDGVYAIGDAATYEGKIKLILTGFSEAAIATHDIYKRVFEGKALHFEYSTTRGIQSL